MGGADSVAHTSLVYGADIMTRREFLSFFLLGGIFSLFSKKVKTEQRPKEAMFWRKAD